MQQKVQAIVLRSRKFRESSSLLTLFTRECGKVTVVAHGRGKKSTLASIHQVFCRAEVVLQLKEQRDLQQISRVESTQFPLHLVEDFAAMQHMFAVCEALDRVTEPNTPNEQVFDMCEVLLSALDRAVKTNDTTIHPAVLRIRFLLKYAEHNGFGFQLYGVEFNSQPGNLDLTTGAPARASSERNSCFSLSSKAFAFLLDIFHGKLPQDTDRQNVVREVLSLLSAYYEVHTGQIISPRAHSFDSDLGNW